MNKERHFSCVWHEIDETLTSCLARTHVGFCFQRISGKSNSWGSQRAPRFGRPDLGFLYQIESLCPAASTNRIKACQKGWTELRRHSIQDAGRLGWINRSPVGEARKLYGLALWPSSLPSSIDLTLRKNLPRFPRILSTNRTVVVVLFFGR